MNFTKLFREAIQGNDQRDSRLTALRDADINLNNVQLEVVECEWTDFSKPGYQKHCSTWEVPKSNSAAAQVKIPSEDKTFIKVTIQPQCTVHGPNKPLTLPLDKTRPDLIEEFGSEIKIDPSKRESTPVHYTIKSKGAVQGAVGRGGATATVCVMEREYRGHFKCTVIMKGFGLASRIPQPIADALAGLKRDQPRNSVLMGLKVKDLGRERVVEFTVEGDLECRWGIKHSMAMR